jgi:hypothetical protein
MVGDGHAMGVASQIAEHVMGPPKAGWASTTQFCRNRRRGKARKAFPFVRAAESQETGVGLAGIVV